MIAVTESGLDMGAGLRGGPIACRQVVWIGLQCPAIFERYCVVQVTIWRIGSRND